MFSFAFYQVSDYLWDFFVINHQTTKKSNLKDYEFEKLWKIL